MSIDAPNSPIRAALTGLGSEWFIYYRIHPDDWPAARQVVELFQATLQAEHPALQARLLYRPAGSDGLLTLMETYALSAPAGAPAPPLIDWPARIEAAATGLAPWLRSPRHVEVFVPCA